jgi:hypothetical protein
MQLLSPVYSLSRIQAEAFLILISKNPVGSGLLRTNLPDPLLVGVIAIFGPCFPQTTRRITYLFFKMNLIKPTN